MAPRLNLSVYKGTHFRCFPSAHRETLRAADLCGLFNRAEHYFAVSVIPPLTFSLLFRLLLFLSSLLSGGLGGPHLVKNDLGLASPLMLLSLFRQTIEMILIYIRVVVISFVPMIIPRKHAGLQKIQFHLMLYLGFLCYPFSLF